MVGATVVCAVAVSEAKQCLDKAWSKGGLSGRRWVEGITGISHGPSKRACSTRPARKTSFRSMRPALFSIIATQRGFRMEYDVKRRFRYGDSGACVFYWLKRQYPFQ